MLKFVPVAFGDPRALSAKPVAFVANGTKSFATSTTPENSSAFSRSVRKLSSAARVAGEGVGTAPGAGDPLQPTSSAQSASGATSVHEVMPRRVGRFHHLLTYATVRHAHARPQLAAPSLAFRTRPLPWRSGTQ